MGAPTKILLASIRSSTEALLRSAFPGFDISNLPSGRAVREAVTAGAADAAVVHLEGDLEHGFQLVRELSAAGVRVLVVGRKDPDLILRAMREGAKEFVLAGDDTGLVSVLRAHVTPAASGGGRICTVFGAKGGVGATTLATNLAGALQRGGNRTCLADLNLDMGDVLAFLDLPGGYSISDAVANVRRLDGTLLESTLPKHASGVAVLAQSHRAGEGWQPEPGELATMLGFLRSHLDAVVIDGVRGFDEASLAALDASDRILLVVTQEVPAVRDARRCVDLFRTLGTTERVSVVLNRFQKAAEITPDVIADTIGLPVAATVANDYPAVLRAMNRGQLLFGEAARAQVTKDIQQLATTLGAASAPAAEPQEKPSLLRRFLRTSHAAS